MYSNGGSNQDLARLMRRRLRHPFPPSEFDVSILSRPSHEEGLWWRGSPRRDRRRPRDLGLGHGLRGRRRIRLLDEVEQLQGCHGTLELCAFLTSLSTNPPFTAPRVLC